VRGEDVDFEKGKDIWMRAKTAIDKRKSEGGAGHLVVWIPGHTKHEDVVNGKTTEVNRNGNDKVDALAKEGAAQHACPKRLSEGAKQRTKLGKVLHEGFASILLHRKEVLKASTTCVAEEEEYPEDPWASQHDQTMLNRLGLLKRKRRCKELQVEASRDDQEEEAAMKVLWPDFVWHQNEAAYTVRRGTVYEGKGQPFGAEATKALRWYWSQLSWHDDADAQAADLGVSWRELAVDFWCATGVVLRFPRHKLATTSVQHLAEAFAAASRALEKEETEKGGWVWRGRCGRTSSLAPFGQKAAVAGLTVRPRLLHSSDVGVALCRLAVAATNGQKEEVVEKWPRRSPPSWRRWHRADAEYDGGGDEQT
jgi:hypothetical protein